jgi:predicted PurR-regulated permease PerM
VSSPPTLERPTGSADPPSARIAITSIRPRAVITIIGLVVVVAAALWLLWLSKRIITWVLIAMFLAVALNPAVDAFQRWLRLRRVPAISLTFLIGLMIASGVGLLLVPPLIDAGQQLADDAPGYVDRLAETSLVQDLDRQFDIVDRLREFVNELPDRLGGAGTAVDVAQTLLSGLVGGLTVLVLTFLFLIYGRALRDQGVEVLPERHRARVMDVLDRMYKSVGGYVAGNLVVSIIAGVAAYIALSILDIPAAAALAFWVGIADLVPLVGATVGAIPATAVAFFSGWPTGVAVAAFFLIYQQVENHFVQPLVMRRTTSLNPLLVLIAVLLGAQLLGIFGALIAIPVGSMIKIVVQDWWAHRTPRAPEPAGPAPLPPAERAPPA